MARIVKRKVQRGKKYEVRWSYYEDAKDGGPPARRFGQQRFTTYEAAKAKKAELESKASTRELSDHRPGKETFGVWAERWLRAKESAIKPSTARTHRRLLKASVLPAFGSRPIRSITTGDIQDFVLDLQARGLAPNTIKHHCSTARLVLKFAAQARAIPTDPATGVELPSNRSTGRTAPEPSFFTEEEIAALAGQMEPPYDLLLLFMCYTGLRSGEVAGLEVRDLDLMRKRVSVRRTRQRSGGQWEIHTPKSGKVRHVPIPGWLAADLQAYLGRHPRNADPEAPLWPGRRNGDTERFAGGRGAVTYDSPWQPGPFRRQFKAALVAVGLPEDSRLHDTRHTYVSLCASAGLPLYRIAEYVGHANEGVTRAIYTHLFDADADADMELLTRPARQNGLTQRI